jgi:hypothetical protein
MCPDCQGKAIVHEAVASGYRKVVCPDCTGHGRDDRIEALAWAEREKHWKLAVAGKGA